MGGEEVSSVYCIDWEKITMFFAIMEIAMH